MMCFLANILVMARLLEWVYRPVYQLHGGPTARFSWWCLGGVTFALQLLGHFLHLVSKKHAVVEKFQWPHAKIDFIMRSVKQLLYELILNNLKVEEVKRNTNKSTGKWQSWVFCHHEQTANFPGAPRGFCSGRFVDLLREDDSQVASPVAPSVATVATSSANPTVTNLIWANDAVAGIVVGAVLQANGMGDLHVLTITKAAALSTTAASSLQDQEHQPRKPKTLPGPKTKVNYA
jgi:hypothetical protein